MAISAQYLNDFEKNYTKVVYQLLKEKLFVSFGLELTATKLKFMTNADFPLVGKTFAFFSPVDESISINIEDPFFTKCTTEDMRIAKMLFILFHEAYHKTLMHSERCGARDHSIWNIAADYEVHNMLYLYDECCCADDRNALRCYFEKIKDMLKLWNNPKYEADPKNGDYSCLFSEKLLEHTAEEIYQMIISTKKVKQRSFTMSLSQMLGSGKSPSNQQQAGSGKQQQDQQNQQNQDGSENDEGSAGGEDEGNSNNGSSADNSGEGQETDSNVDGQTGKKNGKGKGKGKATGSTESDGNDDGSSTDSQAGGKDSGKTGQESGSQSAGKTSNPQTGNNSGSSSSGNTVRVTETTYTLPDGRTHTAIDIQWPDQNQLPADMKKSKDQQKADKDNKELRKQLMEQNIRQAAERNKGNLSAKCEIFLKKLFKIKVDWEKILKSSLQTILSKSDYFTWARPRTSMFALDDIYLPDIVEDNQEYGTLIVARDESGSMSDEEVAKCGAIIADAKEHYKKIIILKHDTDIQYEGEFEELTDDVIKMLCTRATCGGTSHNAVFKYIADYQKKHKYEDDSISCVILMTDCCSDIQDCQDQVPTEIPMVYLVPEQGMEYTKGIRGKVIPIEL